MVDTAMVVAATLAATKALGILLHTTMVATAATETVGSRTHQSIQL